MLGLSRSEILSYVFVILILVLVLSLSLTLKESDPEGFRKWGQQILADNLGERWKDARTGDLVKFVEDGKILVFGYVSNENRVRLYYGRQKFPTEYSFDDIAGKVILILDDDSDDFKDALVKHHRQTYGSNQHSNQQAE